MDDQKEKNIPLEEDGQDEKEKGKEKQKSKFIDDGETIANISTEEKNIPLEEDGQDRKEKGKEKQKSKFVDDGETIANMNIEGFRWYDKRKSENTNTENDNKIKLTRKEKRALYIAALKAYLPGIITVLVSLGLIFLLISLWLN